ncbi:MAG: hypothetical protein ACK4GE_01685 [Caldimicrobium sp.]
MVSYELIELQRVIEEERVALMKGAVEEILKWSSYKIRLIRLLEEKELSMEEKSLLKDLYEKNEKNKRLIEAGLNFVQEAYKLLTNFLIEKELYGKRTECNNPKVISKKA